MNGKNPIVGNDYNKLVQAMLQCEEIGELPQVLEIKDTSDITLSDVQNLITDFEKDTDLHMRFEAEMCPVCNALHAFLCIDYPDEEESEPRYLN